MVRRELAFCVLSTCSLSPTGAFWIIGLAVAIWLIKVLQRVKQIMALRQGVAEYNVRNASFPDVRSIAAQVVRLEGLRNQLLPWTREAVHQILSQRSVHTPTTVGRVEVSSHLSKESTRVSSCSLFGLS